MGSRRRVGDWRARVAEQFAIRWVTHKTAQLIRRDIGLSDVRDIQGLIRLVSERRGKPINVLRVPLPTKVSALCISTSDVDFVVIDSAASELTQLHATLHELGHFLLDAHDTSGEGNEDVPLPQKLARELAPALNPDAVTTYFKRSHYASQQERRVEAFATVMLERHLMLRRESHNGLTATLTHRRTGV